MHRWWSLVLEPVLTQARPKRILEIGSDRGTNTRKLLDFCRDSGAQLHAIDPYPKFPVDEWKREFGEAFVMHEALSLEVLPTLPSFDAVLIDGDHNWYTVLHELRALRELSDSPPLMCLHDVGWPYARRDLYYDPDTIPEDARHPHAKKGILPDTKELVAEGGLNAHLDNALNEGGPRNGVLTAVEDFLEETGEFRFSLLHGFNGLGILYTDAHKSRVPFLAQVDPGSKDLVVALETARLNRQIAHADDLRRLRKRVEDRDDRIRALTTERKELIASNKRLASWLEEMCMAFDQVLQSKRYRLGGWIGDNWRRITFRSPQPQPAPPAQRHFESWKQDADEAPLTR